MVEEKYRAAGLEMTEHRVKLAKMPRGAKPLPNPVGTAPGILVEERETIIIALPGVPAEMKGIFEESVEPILRERGPRIAYVEKEVRVRGVPESSAAPVIERAMKLSPRLYIKSHPSGIETGAPVLTLQIIATGDTSEEAERIVAEAERFLRDELARLGGVFEEAEAGGEG
jgi:nicotinamide-nucleotide amidase